MSLARGELSIEVVADATTSTKVNRVKGLGVPQAKIYHGSVSKVYFSGLVADTCKLLVSIIDLDT